MTPAGFFAKKAEAFAGNTSRTSKKKDETTIKTAKSRIINLIKPDGRNLL